MAHGDEQKVTLAVVDRLVREILAKQDHLEKRIESVWDYATALETSMRAVIHGDSLRTKQEALEFLDDGLAGLGERVGLLESWAGSGEKP